MRRGQQTGLGLGLETIQQCSCSRRASDLVDRSVEVVSHDAVSDGQ